MDISKLQVGDVGFSFNKTKLISSIIYKISILGKHRKKRPAKLSHSFIYIGHGLIAEATFNGIVIVNLEKYLDKDFDIEFQTPVIPFTQEEKQIIFSYAARKAGIIKYSFGQLFVILFHKWFKSRVFDYNQKEMQCSEFVSEIYSLLGRKLTDQDNSMNSPIDVYESEQLKDIE